MMKMHSQLAHAHRATDRMGWWELVICCVKCNCAIEFAANEHNSFVTAAVVVIDMARWVWQRIIPIEANANFICVRAILSLAAWIIRKECRRYIVVTVCRMQLIETVWVDFATLFRCEMICVCERSLGHGHFACGENFYLTNWVRLVVVRLEWDIHIFPHLKWKLAEGNIVPEYMEWDIESIVCTGFRLFMQCTMHITSAQNFDAKSM